MFLFKRKLGHKLPNFKFFKRYIKTRPHRIIGNYMGSRMGNGIVFGMCMKIFGFNNGWKLHLGLLFIAEVKKNISESSKTENLNNMNKVNSFEALLLNWRIFQPTLDCNWSGYLSQNSAVTTKILYWNIIVQITDEKNCFISYSAFIYD